MQATPRITRVRSAGGRFYKVSGIKELLPSVTTILDVINKPKYWDLYREMYDSLGDDDTTFRRLFGDEFAQAYEEQMQRLASSRTKR